jgi:acyl-CoA reductase-like NAD-dependent aldehyde dehydrogenase
MDYRLLIDGQWVDAGPALEVKNKYDGKMVGTVPTARKEDVEAAIDAAERAEEAMADMPAYKRADILLKTAALLRERSDELAKTIAAEAGKALKFARAEVDRAISTFTIAAEESKRLHGETIPLDAVPAGEGYFGFWTRRPVGVIAAISPFNFPLNLVAHKVAPALASGNTLVLKPASTTPLAAVKLCQILMEAGLPAGAINLVVGSGGTVGEWLVTDPRVDKITFTGSPEIGRHILSLASKRSPSNWEIPLLLLLRPMPIWILSPSAAPWVHTTTPARCVFRSSEFTARRMCMNRSRKNLSKPRRRWSWGIRWTSAWM